MEFSLEAHGEDDRDCWIEQWTNGKWSKFRDPISLNEHISLTLQRDYPDLFEKFTREWLHPRSFNDQELIIEDIINTKPNSYF